MTKRTHFDRHPEPVEGCGRLFIGRISKKKMLNMTKRTHFYAEGRDSFMI